MRSQQEIRESLFKEFEKDFPDEHVHDCVFAIYMVQRFVDLTEMLELYRFFREPRNCR